MAVCVDAERRRRLVHDDELRVPQHRLRDRDRLALTAGQRRDRLTNGAHGGHREARRASRWPTSPSVLVEQVRFVRSRPRNMFWTMSRLSARARSWCTVSIPSAAASRGVRMCTGSPFPVGSRRRRARGCRRSYLISTDLPAPLSPTSAVTSPAGMSRLTPAQRLHRHRSCLLDARAARAAGRRSPVRRRLATTRWVDGHVRWSSRLPADPCRRAGLGHRPATQRSDDLTELVLDHGVVHVLGRDPHRGQQHGRDVGLPSLSWEPLISAFGGVCPARR